MGYFDEEILDLDIYKEGIRPFEGYRNKPYDDKTSEPISNWDDATGSPTVGIGHKISRDNWDSYRAGVDDNRVEADFDSDVKSAVSAAKRLIYNFDDLPVKARTSAVGLAFQLGATGYGGFKRHLSALSGRDWATAADEIVFNEDRTATDYSVQDPTRSEYHAQNLRDLLVEHGQDDVLPDPIDVAGPPPTPAAADDIDTSGYKSITLPISGREALYPPDMPEDEAIDWIRENHPEEFPRIDHSANPITQYISTVYGSALKIPLAMQYVLAEATDNQPLYERTVKELREVSQRQSEILGVDPVNLESMERAYDERGVPGALAEFAVASVEGIGQALGHMTIPAAVGAALGATIGFFTPVPGGAAGGAALGATTAASLSRWLGFTGSMMSTYMAENVERAYYEGDKKNLDDINLAKQFALSVGQAGLDALTMRLATGFKFLGKTEKTAALGAIGRALERIDRSTGLKKIMGIMVEEEIAELGQTAMERYAAGLPVSPAHEDAFREYAEIALMTLAPSMGFGVGGHYSGKLRQSNSLRLERHARDTYVDMVEAMRAVDALGSDYEGQKIEDAAETRRLEKEEVYNRRAEIEIELQKAISANDSERISSLGADLARVQATYDGTVSDIGEVTVEDIHAIARSRNIAWDDDAAFISFTMRHTGKPKIDLLNKSDLRTIYQILSDMPRQDRETSLEIAPDQSVIDLARRLMVGTGKMDLSRSKVIDALFGEGASNELSDEIQEKIHLAYRVKGADLGLWSIRPGKPISKLFRIFKSGKIQAPSVQLGDAKKGTVESRLSEENYQKILDHVRKTTGDRVRPEGAENVFMVPGEQGAGRGIESPSASDRWAYRHFIWIADRTMLSSVGISTPNEYQRLIAYALMRGDIVRRDNRYVLTEQAVKPGFKVVVDGVEEDQIYTTLREAQRVVEIAYNPFDYGKPASEAYIIESDPSLIDPDPVSGKRYEASKKASVYHIIRDDKNRIVRIESNKKDANNWVRLRDVGSSAWNLVLDGKSIGRHATYKDAMAARKKFVKDKKYEFTRTIFSEMIMEKVNRGIKPSDIDREAVMRVAFSRATGKANNFARDRGLKPVKFKTESTQYSIESSKGFVVKETRLRGGEGDVRRSDPKPIAFYENRGGRGRIDAERKAERLGGKREWREAVGGKLTRTKEESRRRLEALERPARPDTVTELEENFPILGPELPSIQATLEREVRPPEDVPALDVPAPEFTPEQQSKVDELKKFLKKVLIDRKLDDTFRISLVKALDDAQFANFDHATNTIEISLTDGLLAGDLDNAIKTIAPLLNSESIHGLRRLGAISRSEWKTLSKYVKNRKITQRRLSHYNERLAAQGMDPLPDGATYLDMSKAMYAKQGSENNWIDDDYVEEAVSAAFGDWSVDRKVASGRPEGLFRKTVRTITSLGRGLKESNYNSAEALFNDLYGKDFGVRVELGRVKDDWWLRRPDEFRRVELLSEKVLEERTKLRGKIRRTSVEGETVLGEDPEGLQYAIDEAERQKEIDERDSIDSPNVVDPDRRLGRPTVPTHGQQTFINRIVKRFGFNKDVPSDEGELVGGSSRGANKNPDIWGRVPFGKRGDKKSSGSRVVVTKGHYEGGDRGYGEAALKAHEDAIQNETDYGTWQELLDGFFDALGPISKGKLPENISVYSEPGRVSYVWRDHAGKSNPRNPITVVLDENPDTGDYRVVAAYPSYKYVQPPGSHRSSQGFPDKFGPDVSAEAVAVATGPDKKLSESDTKRFSLANPSEVSSPEENAVLKGMIKSENDSDTFWKKVRKNTYDWGNNKGIWDEDTFHTVRQAFFDEYNSILQSELSLKGKLKETADVFVNQLADSSAHSAALNRNRASRYWENSLRLGYPIYQDGVVKIGAYKTDIDGNYVKEDSDADGNPVLLDPGEAPVLEGGLGLINRVRIRGLPEGLVLDGVLDVDGNPVKNGSIFEHEVYAVNEDGSPEIGGFEIIMDPIATTSNNLLDPYYQFAAAKRGHRLDAQGKQVPLDDKQIAAGLSMAKKHPEILVVHENYQRWNDGMVDFGIASGWINKEAGGIWKSYHDHIPFFPEVNDPASTPEILRGPGFAVLGVHRGLAGASQLKSFEGHDRKMIQPTEAIAKNSMKMIESSLRTIAANRALRNEVMMGGAEYLGTEHPKGIPSDLRIVRTWIDGEARYFSVDDRLLHESLTGSLEGHHPYTGVLSVPARWIREWVTRDPNFNAKNVQRDSLSVWMTNMATFKPLIDPIRQLGKNLKSIEVGIPFTDRKIGGKVDPQDAYLQLELLGQTGRMRPGSQQIGQTRFRRTGFDPAKADLDLGGTGLERFYLDQGPRRFAKTRHSFNRFRDITGEMSMFGEMSTREKVYEQIYKSTREKLLDRGYDLKVAERKAQGEAAHQAAEVLNFSRHGSNPYWRIVTSLIPFLNAKTQGIDQFLRSGLGLSALRMSPAAVANSMIRRGIYISMLSSLYTTMVHDDEDWRKLRPEQRDDFFNWPIPGTGRFITQPIPFEAGVVFKLLPEIVTRSILDKVKHGEVNWRETISSTGHAVGQIFGGWPVPQFIKTPYEHISNHDTYTGREIVPFYKEGLGHLDANPSTHRAAMLLARATGGSALTWQHTWNGAIAPGLLTTVTEVLSDLLGLVLPDQLDPSLYKGADAATFWNRSSRMPLVGALISSETSGGLKTDYYDFRNVSSDLVRKINALHKLDPAEASELRYKNRQILRFKDYTLAIQKRLKTLRDERYRIMNHPYMDGPSKNRRINRITELENSVIRNIPSIRRQADMPVDWNPLG